MGVVVLLVLWVLTPGCKGPAGPDGEDASLPDSLSPQVEWLAPEAGSVIETAVTLRARASDDQEVWRLSFYIGGFDFAGTLADSAEGIYTYEWAADDFPEGPCPLMAQVWDAYRNTASTPVIMVEVK